MKWRQWHLPHFLHSDEATMKSRHAQVSTRLRLTLSWQISPSLKYSLRPGRVVKAFGASTPEAEEEGSRVQGQPRLNGETWSKTKQMYSWRLRIQCNPQDACLAGMKSQVQYPAPPNLKPGVGCSLVPHHSAGGRRRMTSPKELQNFIQSKCLSLL